MPPNSQETNPAGASEPGGRKRLVIPGLRWWIIALLFGAAVLSFGEGIELNHGDVMQVRFEGFGRALRNPVRIIQSEKILVDVSPL